MVIETFANRPYSGENTRFVEERVYYDNAVLGASLTIALVSSLIGLIILIWFIVVMNAINRNVRNISERMDALAATLAGDYRKPAPPPAEVSAGSNYKCWKCGAPVGFGSETCGSCGAKLIWPKA